MPEQKPASQTDTDVRTMSRARFHALMAYYKIRIAYYTTKNSYYKLSARFNRTAGLLRSAARIALYSGTAYIAMQVLPEQITHWVKLPVAKVMTTVDAGIAIKREGLTAGETSMVRAVFGNDFETSNIRKNFHDNAIACTGRRATACVLQPSNDIQFVSAKYFSDDYSRDGSISGGRTHVFMHEMTHIWQNRQPLGTVDQCRTYDLPKSDLANTQKTFDDYCNEQQGELVGVYASVFLRPGLFLQLVTFDPDNYKSMNRVREIVEAKFPHAIASRKAAQRQAVALLSCANDAEGDAGILNCSNRYYLNLSGQRLSVAPEQVTFTLPDGTVRYPVVEEARRLAAEERARAPQKAAPRPTS